MSLRIGLLALAITGIQLPGLAVRGTATTGDKAAADAVVWLDAPNAPRPAPRSKATLAQRNLSFYPHVLVVQLGTSVDFPNNDRVFHNVFSYRDAGRFDLGLYPVGTVKLILFDHEGLSRIFCNIHPHMAGYVMVVATPYFAVSDARGSFTIPQVPAGTYTYHAWRPGGTILNGSTTVRQGVALDVRWP